MYYIYLLYLLYILYFTVKGIFHSEDAWKKLLAHASGFSTFSNFAPREGAGERQDAC